MSNDVKLSSQKIQKLRHAKCWSQEELATASGWSVRTIQRIEKTGNASLESTKALASVFNITPDDLQELSGVEHVTFSFILKYSWLAAFAIASILFGLWIVDILIPTLKGADFSQQYQLHVDFRYLDFGGLSFILGFLLLGLNIWLEHISKKKLLDKAFHNSQ
jgi:transcriptional regulator with XRE-family HTH domain